MTALADLRRAVRSLSRQPWFAFAAIASLAFGIGANVTVFTIVDALLFRPLPYRDSSRLVFVRAENPRLGVTRGGVSLTELDVLRRDVPSLRPAGVVREGDFNVVVGERTRRVRGAIVSSGTFATLGVPPQVGGTFSADEDRPGAARRVVVSDGLWRETLGGRTDLSGATLRVDGVTFDVAGVMPAGFQFPERADLWIPLGASHATGTAMDRDVRAYQLVARLAPGASAITAWSEVASVSRAFEMERPVRERGWVLALISAESERGESARPAVYLLFALVTCVLLVASANLASLLTVRAAGRRREMAIRSALGASQRRLVWHGLSESVVLATFGMTLGMAIAVLGVRGVRLAFPAETLPFWLRFHIDWRVLGYALGVTAVTTLAFGLGPALWSARHGLANGLMAGSRSATHAPGRGRLTGALIGGQVAVSLVLVVVASLLANAVRTMGSTNLGYQPHGLLTTDVEPRGQRYAAADARRAYFASLAERIEAIPGVQRATGFDLWGAAPVDIVRAVGKPLDRAEAPVYTVLPAYFETLRVPITAGRGFDLHDVAGTARAAIVNATFARRYWPDEPAVGHQIRLATGRRDTTWFTVVGVVGDVRRNPADPEWEPHIYVSALQFPPRRLQLVVRTQDGALPARALSDAATAVDPAAPLGPILTMEQQIGAWTAPSRFFAIAVGAFGFVAMLIALAGVYGVVAGGVVARTREFGIRIALGATPSNVVATAVRRGARLAATGAGIGLMGAIAVSQVLITLPFGVERVDGRLVAATALALVAVTLLAAYGPARRAGRVAPTIALSDDA